MCRLSAEMFAVIGGGGAFATAAAFAKAHWDAIRDRKAFQDAKEREKSNGEGSASIESTGPEH